MNTTSQKTSIIGVAGAIILAIQPIVATGTFDIRKDWINLVGAAVVAAFGFYAKDFDASGLPGQVKQISATVDQVADLAAKVDNNHSAVLTTIIGALDKINGQIQAIQAPAQTPVVVNNAPVIEEAKQPASIDAPAKI